MLADLALVILGAGVALGVIWVISVNRRLPAATRVAPAVDYRAVLDSLQLGVTVTNSEGVIVYTNPVDATMHGFTVDELVGKPGSILAPPATRKTASNSELRDFRTWRRDAVNMRSNGEVFPVRLRTEVLRDTAGITQGMVTLCEDISEERRRIDAETVASLHDPLTGLANRAFLLDLVERAILRSARHGGYHFAVLYMNLDRFRLINETLGHDAGDALLVQVSKRLTDCLRPNDVAARIAGDEFAVLLDALRQPTDATVVADRIVQAMDAPFTHEEREVYLAQNIGIAHGDAAIADAERHLKNAGEAMHAAKRAGQNLYRVFEETAKRRMTMRLQLETDLRKAIDLSEMRAVYQPIVDLVTEATTGFEALVRWHHRERGTISPAEFIPAAEETGLVVPIGWWMVEVTCQQLVEWLQEFPDNLITVNVNLSVRQLRQASLIERVLGLLDGANLPRGRLKLEITESMLMDNAQAQIAKLRQLRDAGVGVVIDDFGTGYSSLSYLQQIEFDVLKIDRSFLPVADGKEGWDIVRMIIELARDKGAAVVAEGIETAWQATTLREMGCHWGQGFLFARPLDPAAATERLREEAKK